MFFTSISLLFECASFLRLRFTAPDRRRPFRVPGGTAGAFLCVVPQCTCAVAAMIAAAVDDPSIVCVARRRHRHRRHHRPPPPPPLFSNVYNIPILVWCDGRARRYVGVAVQVLLVAAYKGREELYKRGVLRKGGTIVGRGSGGEATEGTALVRGAQL